MRKLRPSTVQDHPSCALIDSAIARDETPASIGRRFGLTPWAVARRRDILRRDHAEYLAGIGRLPLKGTKP